MKLWKGITVAALVLTLAPIVGVAAASQAEAAAPIAVKAAVTSYNPSCENPDGTYNGGVCKTTFPAYSEDLSDEPKQPEYLEWPGTTLRNYEQQVAHMNSVHSAGVASCKSYVPYSHRTNPGSWNSFCEGLPKLTVSPFTVRNVVTGVVR